jgi:hypothetical protein
MSAERRMYVTREVAESAATELCRLLPDAPPDCQRRVLAESSSATTDKHAGAHRELVGISDASRYGAQLMSHVPVAARGVIGPLQ